MGDVVEIRDERDAETVALFGGVANVVVAEAQASWARGHRIPTNLKKCSRRAQLHCWRSWGI